MKLLETEIKKARKALDEFEKQNESVDYMIGRMAECIKSGGRIVFSCISMSSKIVSVLLEEIDTWYGFNKDQFILLNKEIGKESDFDSKELKDYEATPLMAPFIMQSIDFNKNDILIVVSNSGNTEFIKETVKIAKGLGASTFAITSNSKSYSSINCEKSINVKLNEELSHSSIYLHVLNTLLIGISKELSYIINDRMVYVSTDEGKIRDYTLNTYKIFFGKIDDDITNDILEYGLVPVMVRDSLNISIEEAIKFKNENKYELKNLLNIKK